MLPTIHIPTPCSENWDKMQANAKGRFCANCQKTVIDFNQFTKEEVLAIMQQQPKGLCGRISQKKLNEVNSLITNPKIDTKSNEVFETKNIVSYHRKTSNFVQQNLLLKHFKTLGLATLSLALVNCTNIDKSEEENKQKIELVNNENIEVANSDSDIMGDIISDLISYMPSPLNAIEIIEKIDKKKLNFKADFLNEIIPISNELSQDDLMIRYGFYSVDVYYAALYGNKKLVKQYLYEIDNIEKKLKLDKVLENKELLQKLLNESHNLKDSVLNIAGANLDKLENYCGDNKAIHYHDLLMVMGHLEAMYLSSLHYQDNSNIELRDEIAMQKNFLNQIVVSFEKFKKTTLLKEISADFKNLQQQFECIELITTSLPPTIIKEKNGDMNLIDNTKTTVKVSDKDFVKVIQAIQTMRNKYKISQNNITNN
jgi:hypothetical protein